MGDTPKDQQKAPNGLRHQRDKEAVVNSSPELRIFFVNWTTGNSGIKV